MFRFRLRDSDTPIELAAITKVSRVKSLWELLYRCLFCGPFTKVKGWFHSSLHLTVSSNLAAVYCCCLNGLALNGWVTGFISNPEFHLGLAGGRPVTMTVMSSVKPTG